MNAAHASDETEIDQHAKDRVPKKTQKNNRWLAKAWKSWTESELEQSQAYPLMLNWICQKIL